MQELRIANGYHRGATLPLDREPLSIGSDDSADVVLADPGVALLHARLQPAGRDGWALLAAEGVVRGAGDNSEPAQLTLQTGEFARVGPVWITVCDAGAPWQDPPAEPTDLPAAATDEDFDEEPEAAQDAAAESHDALQAEGGRNDNGHAGEPPEPGSGAPGRTQARASRHSRGLQLLLGSVGTVAVLSAAAAYALTSQPGAVDEESAARKTAELRRQAALPLTLPPRQLQDALRKRLGETDLLGRLTLELSEGEWTIRGALNEEDAERLQRMLRAFSQRYVIDFPINVKIGSAESMLPFRITQVLSGNDPSIVTDDGRRLYVGDEYRGVRLAAVAGSQLKFTGKHDLNVSW